ncbi:MAG: ribosome silencing factor [Chloroflexi bacterium]|nr:ribosome silencing factor [Chloroflexota bacterium]
MSRALVEALEAKKAEDIVLLDVRGQCMFADYFIIGTGTSDRMLGALAEGVREAGGEKRHAGGRTEGRPQGGWILVDFGSVIVHLFSPERREYYALEELWHEGKVVLRVQ